MGHIVEVEGVLLFSSLTHMKLRRLKSFLVSSQDCRRRQGKIPFDSTIQHLKNIPRKKGENPYTNINSNAKQGDTDWRHSYLYDI